MSYKDRNKELLKEVSKLREFAELAKPVLNSIKDGPMKIEAMKALSLIKGKTTECKSCNKKLTCYEEFAEKWFLVDGWAYCSRDCYVDNDSVDVSFDKLIIPDVKE